MAAIDAGVALVAEDRDGDVGVLRAVGAQPRLAKDQRPAGVAVLLAQFRGLVPPCWRHAAGLDLVLLGLGVALPGRRDQARVHDLPCHRE
jgi:hypothetical protein